MEEEVYWILVEVVEIYIDLKDQEIKLFEASIISNKNIKYLHLLLQVEVHYYLLGEEVNYHVNLQCK
jgi:hypothetical protein